MTLAASKHGRKYTYRPARSRETFTGSVYRNNPVRKPGAHAHDSDANIKNTKPVFNPHTSCKRKPDLANPSPHIPWPRVQQARSRKSYLDVHEWHGKFHGRAARFKMTSVIGHVLSVDFPPKYQNWETTDPASLFDAPTVKTEATPKVLSAHPSLFHIICACDAAMHVHEPMLRTMHACAAGTIIDQ